MLKDPFVYIYHDYPSFHGVLSILSLGSLRRPKAFSQLIRRLRRGQLLLSQRGPNYEVDGGEGDIGRWKADAGSQRDRSSFEQEYLLVFGFLDS